MGWATRIGGIGGRAPGIARDASRAAGLATVGILAMTAATACALDSSDNTGAGSRPGASTPATAAQHVEMSPGANIPPATSPAQPLPTGTPGMPAGAPPHPAAVDWASPSSVSAAAVRTMWTMDTAIDTSQYQAELRAAGYLTSGYLAQLRAARPVADPGEQWDTWAKHKAYTRVQLLAERGDVPPDTATTAYRQWGITATVTGRDHWQGPKSTATVFVVLTQVSGRWLVSALETSS